MVTWQEESKRDIYNDTLLKLCKVQDTTSSLIQTKGLDSFLQTKSAGLSPSLQRTKASKKQMLQSVQVTQKCLDISSKKKSHRRSTSKTMTEAKSSSSIKSKSKRKQRKSQVSQVQQTVRL